MRRTAFSLTEVMVAVSLLALAGVAVLGAIVSSARGAADATEVQLATLLAAKVLDRSLAAGFERLSARASGETSPVDTGNTVVDGSSYRATLKIDVVSRGLLRLSVGVTWMREGAPPTADPEGSLSAFRYLSDPMLMPQ